MALSSATLLVYLLSLPMFNSMLAYDARVKVYGFVATLLAVDSILHRNGECAGTAGFLVRVILVQVLAIGLVTMCINYLYPIKGGQKHKYTFTLVLGILLVSSALGLLYSLYSNLYLQLLQFPELPLMLALITAGFVAVWLCDSLYLRWWRERNIGARRKIFHFVPVFLLPLLAAMHYRLFTLMVFGAFYLFWLVELIRYFGKLARTRAKEEDEQEYNNGSNLFHRLTQLLDDYNRKISQLPLMRWMEELNSSRQPYFWFTHLSLILGLSVTYIYYPPLGNSPLQQNMSIILVLSDAMAALIGRQFGKPSHRIPYTNGKTMEGFAAFVATCAGLQLLMQGMWGQGQGGVGLALLTGVACGLGQLCSGDLDNVATVLVYILVQEIYVKL